MCDNCMIDVANQKFNDSFGLYYYGCIYWKIRFMNMQNLIHENGFITKIYFSNYVIYRKWFIFLIISFKNVINKIICIRNSKVKYVSFCKSSIRRQSYFNKTCVDEIMQNILVNWMIWNVLEIMYVMVWYKCYLRKRIASKKAIEMPNQHV